MDPLTYRTVVVNTVELQVSVSNEGGERGLALLLHGFPELAFSWRYQIPALVDAGYEVWAPNLRGYGASSKPRPVGAYDLDLLLDDVAGLVDASGHDKVTLIGHDWGAVLAWMFAIRDVRPLERLVIMNVPHPACMRRELRTFRQLRKSWYVFAFQIPWLPEKLLTARRARAVRNSFVNMAVDKTRFPDVVTDVYREAALGSGAMRSMINYYRAAVRARRTAAAEPFPVITTPTLMLWGLEDSALGKHTTDGTDEYVDDLTMRFLPDVSHWVQQEAPETVNAMLSAWLDGHEVPEAADITYERLDEPAGAPNHI
ncbi:MAG: alpha/beta hydrolase [Actinomycetia bacterium]|nr:alpha/beta hydrolase [Actinomycetes bacterium]MCP4960410.1 alpha/beta hydrolase [Actinomycetes bacterium]